MDFWTIITIRWLDFILFHQLLGFDFAGNDNRTLLFGVDTLGIGIADEYNLFDAPSIPLLSLTNANLHPLSCFLTVSSCC